MTTKFLTDKVALVTGASRGLGKAIALALAAEGASIAAVARSEEALKETLEAIRATGGVAEPYALDVADAVAAEATVEKIAARFQHIDVLVNNAGVTRDNLIFRMTESDWDTVMGVHLRGAFLITKAAQKHMVEAGFGRIVNLSSTSALGNRGQANYSAAKAGLQGFTKTLAFELGKFGVTANAVAPGFIATEMTKATAARMGLDFEEMKSQIVSQIPVNRAGQPEDIAELAAFLVSDGAGFVSGQVIYAAGGPMD